MTIARAKNGTPGSATETEFDQNKWIIKEDKDYPYRDRMLKSLISSGKLKTLKKAGVADLLGGPDRSDTNYLFYRITQKRIGFFPLHTKTLVIKFAADSSVTRIKIHE